MFRTIDPYRNLSHTSERGTEYDVVRTEDGVQVHVDIPGIDPAHVDLTVDGRSLVLRADRPARAEGTVVARRRTGTLHRRFHLGEQLDADRLEADYALGVLTVTIPFAESAKPRKVLVGTTADAIPSSSEV